MRYVTCVCASLLLFSFLSCNSGGDGSTPTAGELIDQGWQSYSSRSYQAALDKFNEALGMDGSLVDGYNGAGWASAKLNQLSTSLAKLTTGLSKDTSNLEIKAALAIVYNAQRTYAQSISFANRVLAVRPNWSFSHDATVSAADLHLLLAEDYFAMANYNASLVEVKALNPAFDADVSAVHGQAALAGEIERLRSIV